MTTPYEEDVFRVLIAVCEFSDQADKKDVIEIEHQENVTVFCSEPRSSAEIMDFLGLKDIHIIPNCTIKYCVPKFDFKIFS